MGKTIKLHNEEYEIQLKAIIEYLSTSVNFLDECAVNLAVTGKWKKWNNSQEEGTIMDFSSSIHDTGDFRVDSILQLRENVLITIQTLKKNGYKKDSKQI